MGLFGKKKDIVYPKVCEVFSPEAGQKILNAVKQKGLDYYGRKYRDYLQVTLSALEKPDCIPDKRGWQGIIFGAGMLTKLEPSVMPELDAAIKKYHELVS